jgi:hypothetical protein
MDHRMPGLVAAETAPEDGPASLQKAVVRRCTPYGAGPVRPFGAGRLRPAVRAETPRRCRSVMPSIQDAFAAFASIVQAPARGADAAAGLPPEWHEN